MPGTCRKERSVNAAGSLRRCATSAAHWRAMRPWKPKTARFAEELALVAAADWVTLRLNGEGGQDHRLIVLGSGYSNTSPTALVGDNGQLAETALREARRIVVSDYSIDPMAIPDIVRAWRKLGNHHPHLHQGRNLGYSERILEGDRPLHPATGQIAHRHRQRCWAVAGNRHVGRAAKGDGKAS